MQQQQQKLVVLVKFSHSFLCFPRIRQGILIICGCAVSHNAWGQFATLACEVSTSIWWVEARGTVKPPTVCTTAPTAKNYLAETSIAWNLRSPAVEGVGNVHSRVHSYSRMHPLNQYVLKPHYVSNTLLHVRKEQWPRDDPYSYGE